jgi:hypothetical protein
MNLFSVLSRMYSIYPDVLGYYYLDSVKEPGFLDKMNEYDFVFISSDFSTPINGCTARQVMTSAEYPGTLMWLEQDFSSIKQLPYSEWTDVPTVGFVGRVPIFKGTQCVINGAMSEVNVLHKGFEERRQSLEILDQSLQICCDFHARTAPSGNSAGFWNESHPDFIRHAPLFKTNMLANQYQVCARGNANWSIRFYETLSYGRIPIYIESGGMTAADWHYGDIKERKDDLPFVYVENIKDIEMEVLKFHNEIDSIADIQDACREWYYENYSHAAQVIAFDNMFSDLRVKYV